ncbi:MAG: SO_0444 family Cu/Zn efflux transporter [Phycisphaerae bacterium]|nr:SO_0444 family Cu/Zn efflux transporter [Phycisphaerae bacterium]
MLDFLLRLIVDFWATIGAMAPYLLFGFFVAGLLSVFVSQKLVERHLGGRGFLPVLKATLFGIPLPLCSCGVIPVAMSLRQHGASKGSTVSFLLSTPQTGVDSILVTYSLLGPVFAIFRPVVALVTGLVGGVLVNLFGQAAEDRGQSTENGTAANPQSEIRNPKLEGPQPAQNAGQCCCCHHAATPMRKFFNGMKYGFVSLPRDIGKPLLVGLAIAALISSIVPNDFFAAKLGRGLPAMLVMMLIGIPMYVCASASVPVAAAMILKGLSPGAALVFLITGPATNAAGLATIWNTLGRRTAILYLLTVAGCALAGGIVLDSLIHSVKIGVASHVHNMGPSMVQHLSAVVLLAVLGCAFLTGRRRR